MADPAPAPVPNPDTDLVFQELALPPGAMRGLKGEITIIDNGPLVEMMDFSLRDQTDPDGQKFEVTLSGGDVNSAPLLGLWKGAVLTIDVPVIVMEPVGNPQTRPAAPGTLHYVDATEGMEVPANDAPNRGNYPPAAWRCYYMRLHTMVTEPWRLGFDEWDASTTFQLKLREL